MIGPVAYKLKLPSSTSIHPVFHMSELKKVLGEHSEVQEIVPYMSENYEWKAVPEEIYGYQKNDVGVWEVLTGICISKMFCIRIMICNLRRK